MRSTARTTILGTVAFGCASFAAWHWSGAPGVAQTSAVLTVVERQANIYTYNRQEAPSVAVDAEGNALAVWGSRRQENGTFGIFGRLFDAGGSPIGGELHVNDEMSNNQDAPAIAFGGSAGTDAWIAWQSHGQDGDAGAVVARRFGRVGDTFTALSGDIVVNEETGGDQLQPAIAATDDRVMVAWTTETADGQVVMGRVLDHDGTPVGGEFRLGTTDDRVEWLPAIAAQPDGFVATWAVRDRATGRPTGILARRFDANGAARGDAFTVAAGPDRHDVEPAIDAAADGRFAIAWMSSNADRGYDVLARRFDADGTPRGAEFTVAGLASGAASWHSAAAVAMAADGRFIVAWNAEMKDDAGDEVLARRYDADGAAGDTFTVNRHADGRQTMAISGARRVAWGVDDRLAFAWDGRAGDDGSGIGVTMMVPGTVVATTLAVADAVLSKATPGSHLGEPVPPEFDPNWVPEPPDQVTLAPGQDFGFIGFQSTGWNPPDPDIAVGPNGIIVAVNGGVRYFNKQGNQLWSLPLTGGGGFWGQQGGGGFVFDPVELFDPHSNRFIVVCTEHVGSSDYLTIAISNDDDPSGSSGHNDFIKRRWNLDSLCGFIDFPNLGVDEDAIYVTTDCFDSPGGNKVWIIDKQALIDGEDAFPDFVQMSGGFFSLGSVKTYDADTPAQYFVSAENDSDSSIEIRGLTDPLGSPGVSTFLLPVPTYAGPPGAQQLGSSNRVATVGKRIKNGVYRNGSLWITHTVGQSNTARMRWYEIAMNGWPTSGNDPELVQGGTQNLGTGVHSWFGDVDVDAAGNAAFAFNRSSSKEFVGVWRTFRLAGDPLGQLRDPVQMQASTSPENGSRWGDYGGVHQDPAQPNAFWQMHEYRTSSWRCWVGKFELPVPVCPEDIDGSGAIDIGDVIRLLKAWGNMGGPEDLDGSGEVGINDLILLLAAWGPCA